MQRDQADKAGVRLPGLASTRSNQRGRGDLGKVQSLLDSNKDEGAANLPSDQFVKFDKQSRPLPLVLEQWRGA